MFPMHLGLMDGPFVPHNINYVEPCSFTKVPDALRLKISISSGF